MPVRVQTGDFDLSIEVANLRTAQGSRANRIGAIATFVGTVRDHNENAGIQSDVAALTLEHYPGMTERALEEIVSEATSRWNVFDALVVHRVGPLALGDQIVLVATIGAHRGEAFAACEFIMDYLKTRAPFWKKERTADGERWVDARSTDDASAARWANEGDAGDAIGGAGGARDAP